jgi:hypothetical protein
VRIVLTSFYIVFLVLFPRVLITESGDKKAEITVRGTTDFSIDGKGEALEWNQADWYFLPSRSSLNSVHQTQLKCLYSKKGIYFLFKCQDKKITSTFKSDFADLWNEDVAEIFLWPDESYPVYFEYEISPLNRELVLLIPNLDGQFWGWQPWHYEQDRQVNHLTSAIGGELKSDAVVDGWIAEVFIPYQLFKPLTNVPPVSGSNWRANFYRCDYDDDQYHYWAWQPIEKRFHEFEKFGTLIFE